jgi:hypothetical protein
LRCLLSIIVNGYPDNSRPDFTQDEAHLMKPIALSNTQLDTIFRLAGPLPPPDREAYLREVAAALDGREEIGDGFVARVCAEVQRRLCIRRSSTTAGP